MKKYYVQPEIEMVIAKGERLCDTISITGGDGKDDPGTGDNHFGGGAPIRF